MGKCLNEKCPMFMKEHRLGKDETRCDSCGEVMGWYCWHCKVYFKVEDKKGNRIKECKLCGLFVCPTCEACDRTCSSKTISQELLELLKPEPTEDPNIVLIRDIYKKIEEVKEKIRELQPEKPVRVCPSRGVPISYARQKNKDMFKHLEENPDEDDQAAYEDIMEKINKKEIGDRWSIKEMADKGREGHEERGFCNLESCRGNCITDYKPSKKSKDGFCVVFEKTEDSQCEFFNPEVEIETKWCPNCKNNQAARPEYNNWTHCDCIWKRNQKKGKYPHQKGEHPPLILKKHNACMCNLSPNQFIQIGEYKTKKLREKNSWKNVLNGNPK